MHEKINSIGDQIRLIFGFDIPVPPGSRALASAKLILVNGNSKVAFAATSGVVGYQSLDAAWIRGKGRIPTCEQANINCYRVATKAINMPNVKGVQGNFYPIIPYTVLVAGNKRGDFGIHFDANVPGSAGCIVIRQRDHWQIFEKSMKALWDKDIIAVDLYVQHTIK